MYGLAMNCTARREEASCGIVGFARSVDVLACHAVGEILDPAAAARHSHLRDRTDRDDFIAARVLARGCIAALTGSETSAVTVEQRCARCGGPHGAPTVTSPNGVRVSWSHGGGYVAAGAAWSTIGVDIEVASRVAGTWYVEAPSVLCAQEQAIMTASADPQSTFLRAWTRKEAMIKAGYGALSRLAEIDVTEPSLIGDEAVNVATDGLFVTDLVSPDFAFCAVSGAPVHLTPAEVVLSGRGFSCTKSANVSATRSLRSDDLDELRPHRPKRLPRPLREGVFRARVQWTSACAAADAGRTGNAK